MPPTPAPAPPTPMVVPPAPPPVDARGGGSRATGRGRAGGSAGRALEQSGIYAERNRARTGAQNVGVGNRQVVALNADVEVVLQRHRHRIIERQIHLAVFEDLIRRGRSWSRSAGATSRTV